MATSGNTTPLTGEVIMTSTTPLFNVNTSNVTKHNDTNYLMWSLQIHALINGYELAGYLDGSHPAPSPTVTTDAVTVPNLAFAFWKRQDRLLYSALLGAISAHVQPLVSRASTAAEVWETLTSIFPKPSRGHVQGIKNQIKAWTKGNMTIDTYVRGLVIRFDELATLGKPLDLEDQIEKILEGLPEDYKPVIDQIESKDVPLTIADVHERLCNRESRLISTAAASPTPFPVSANVVQRRMDNNTNNNNTNNNNTYNNRNNGRSRNQQMQTRSFNNNNWQSTQGNNNNRSLRPYLGKCQLCNTQGHSVRRCPQFLSMQHATHNNSPFTPWQPRANMAAILDSGATHHITSDLNNLSLHQPYTGGDDVVIADGSTMSIPHTGSMLLPSQTRALKLDKVLCVPDIPRSLISVYRLCNSNQVSVHFFPAFFQVKDLSTGVPLLQGQTDRGLYVWPVTNPNIVAMLSSTGPRPSLVSWHSHTGVPSSTPTVTSIPMTPLTVPPSLPPPPSSSSLSLPLSKPPIIHTYQRRDKVVGQPPDHRKLL
ncbi:PREDICTED: uncharacterized protein LOC104767850 [Camelina sativa]|uniref:Uncharacterized protein LOC104767850 n=1 Tax=Camelina sativa TaxID=90675 RepID=A0ABM0XS11_CAMSA|nr:PREDICTED: uncharacterized protein LOC104767850 [Camelina sativa]